jgi:hypothetical protein
MPNKAAAGYRVPVPIAAIVTSEKRQQAEDAPIEGDRLLKIGAVESGVIYWVRYNIGAGHIRGPMPHLREKAGGRGESSATEVPSDCAMCHDYR